MIVAPDTQGTFLGVMNLRGIVIPIVDMRIKFNLSNIIYNEMTVVIILNIGERVIGIVVDSVSDVVSLGTAEIQSSPKFAGELDPKYIQGLATINEQMLILIKIKKLMNSKEMLLFDQLTDDIEK
jgi:purine-binding chemotaxis protein CheW